MIHLRVALDAKFWRETLNLSNEELEHVRASRPVDLEFLNANKPDFVWSEVTICIEEWRGGFTHIRVDGPPSAQPSIWCPPSGFALTPEHRSVDLYPGNSDARLWSFDLPGRDSEIVPPTLELSISRYWIKLYATGGRFGHHGEPVNNNTFFSISRDEGEIASHCLTGSHNNTSGYVDSEEAWLRHYKEIDHRHGLVWQLSVRDCELFARAQGNSWEARLLLIADYRKLASDPRSAERLKSVYRSLADSMEERLEEERAKFQGPPN
jgi:hypothetical protein